MAPLQQRNSSQKPSQINRSTILSDEPLLLCTVWFRTHCPCLTLLCLPMPSASSSAPGLGAIFGRKALGFRSSVDSTASWRMMAFSTLLQQLVQLQLSQCRPEAKHSQYLSGAGELEKFRSSRRGDEQGGATYNFRHREFLQLQFFFFMGIFTFTPGSPSAAPARS